MITELFFLAKKKKVLDNQPDEDYKDTSAFGELVNKNGLILKSGKSSNELSMCLYIFFKLLAECVAKLLSKDLDKIQVMGVILPEEDPIPRQNVKEYPKEK